MDRKHCKEAKCEYLVVDVLGNDHCLDTGMVIRNVEWCGIAAGDFDINPKRRNVT